MKKLLITAFIASTMLAGSAMAQTPGEDHHERAAQHREARHDRHAAHKEHREHRRAAHREHHDNHHM